MLLALLRDADDLARRPRFYDALTDNCTTAWLTIAARAGGSVPFDLRPLLNGHLDELLYERGLLVANRSHGLPYEEMRRLHRITDVAQQYLGDGEFSRKVRGHLPER